jgi:hypothetical protein
VYYYVITGLPTPKDDETKGGLSSYFRSAVKKDRE